MGIRTVVQDKVVDRLQFVIDSRPKLDYQPLPWVSGIGARRADGSNTRWALIESEVERLKPATAVDIGCNVGFFTLSLAERGVAAVGLERYPRFLRMAQYAARRAGLSNVALMNADLVPGSMWMVPQADVVLLLSVYHHWVRYFGVEAAREMLKETWDRAGMALFFETGESELPGWFKSMDLGSDPQSYLRAHLEEVCAGSTVRCLGTSTAFAPDLQDERAGSVTRHLFIVERDDQRA